MSEGQRIDSVPPSEISLSKITLGVDSQESLKHPGFNADDYFISPNHSFGLFDGMSGKADPEKASAIMSKVVSSGLRFVDPNKSSETQIKQILSVVFQQANNSLIEASKETQKKLGKSMGSTGTFGIIIPESDHLLAILNATGDSPAVLCRNGVFTRQTRDHTGLYENYSHHQSLYDQIQNRLDNDKERKSLKPEEKVFATFSSGLSQYFGKENIHPSLYTIRLYPNDSLFLFTDGVFSNLTPAELGLIYKENQNQPPDFICSQIVQSAANKSKLGLPFYKPDDATALIIKIPKNNL